MLEFVKSFINFFVSTKKMINNSIINNQKRLFWLIIKRKLYFTILNYTLNYILHPKLLKYTVSTLNYNSCYTLHTAINFAIILDDIT